MWIFVSFLEWLVLMIEKNDSDNSVEGNSFFSESLDSEFDRIRATFDVYHKLIIPFSSRLSNNHQIYLVKQENVVHFTILYGSVKFGISFERKDMTLKPIAMVGFEEHGEFYQLVETMITKHQRQVICMFEELDEIVEKI